MKNLILALALFHCSIAVYAQEKNILDRDVIVHIEPELPDPISNFFSTVSPTVKLNLGIEKYKQNNKAFTAKVMYSSFINAGYRSLSNEYTLYNIDTTFSPGPVSKTSHLGLSLGFKKYRARKGAIAPIGKYIEYELGLHNFGVNQEAHFADEYDSQSGSYILKSINAQKFGITTLSGAVGFGEQWLTDNNISYGFGARFRLHVPVRISDISSSINSESVLPDPLQVYLTDIVGMEWFSVFFKIGYVL